MSVSPHRYRTVIGILVAALLAAAAGSHALSRWLDFNPAALSTDLIGATNRGVPALVMGSSLMYYGLDWQSLSATLRRPVRTLGLPSGSMSELQVFQPRYAPAPLTVVGASVYDLNEHFLCDYHADTVPLARTVGDLWECHADWAYAKRVLSQYPLCGVRWLFPTAGRSLGVMVGLRTKLRAWAGRGGKAEGEGLTLNQAGITAAVERVSDWPEARILRNLSQLRASAQGLQSFDGPKNLAFRRVLRRATAQGQAVVVVFPVSPPYGNTFVNAKVADQFEAALARAQRESPDVRWVRLDQVPELRPARLYWDLVHLNTEGQRLTTRVVQEQLAAIGQPH